MSNQYSINIEMLSDWHIGSGTGRSGSIDRLVKRDRENLPFIPAKTLTGIWRDACEQVALGLDGDNPNKPWHKWVQYIFGNQPALEFRTGKTSEEQPQPAILSVRPAQIPPALKNALRNKPLLQEALTFIKPGIAIDPDSGCAKSDCLRFEEMVRLGTQLVATYTLEGLESGSYEYKTVQSLLAAGVAMIERLGAKRRRGAGKCRVAISYQLEDAIAWIEKNLTPELPPASKKTEQEKQALECTGTWCRVELSLEAKSPLLIHSKTVGNLVKTLDYIPGTFLLSMFSNKLRKVGIDIGEVIAQGKLILTNATPEVEQNGSNKKERKAGKPIPLSLFYKKSDKERETKIIENRLRNSAEDGSQFKGYRSGYISDLTTSDEAVSVVLKIVTKSVETHNTVNDEIQRPNEDVGGVYSYEAIAPGTRFRAELRLCQSLVDVIQDSNWQLLAGDYHIGRTKKDDYGLISLKVESESYNADTVTIDPEKELTVWLLSDVLIRDKRLRPTTNLCDFAEVLGNKLGVNLRIKSAESESTESKRDETMSFLARQNRIDSWQTRWGLPRPSLVGLSAGSCMIFKVDGNLDPTNLSDLQISGIGERRAEGYGQICFNAPILNEPILHISKPRKNDANVQKNTVLIEPKEDGKIFDYARLIEREAWRVAIRKAALLLSDTRESRQEIIGLEIQRKQGKQKIDSKPSTSQLGNLHSALEQLQKGMETYRVIDGESCTRRNDSRYFTVSQFSESANSFSIAW
ncbi:hypothetical protein F7734_26730 [Scytonema sp. UIC 10036]|uniref:RAMP superfamily CRISPR-associated protein n=1 Tax=Scytonema sp. UIC 10036 TaxID=2304196 RepID=UPI0012DAA673|nr:RAMP superfamily CRISPR-associated protein [Scytonema sp. UIC 10036]MUG95755.1 hypothetical protein [Scytonema sp. UIC 10036]